MLMLKKDETDKSVNGETNRFVLFVPFVLSSMSTIISYGIGTSVAA